jgi:hypothetical protein
LYPVVASLRLPPYCVRHSVAVMNMRSFEC